MHHSHSQPKYRPDIDGLRALAVLSVFAFHVSAARLPGGFVGVDIFFVISGFLISGIIQDSLKNGSFSYLQFFAHRVRRIFPALVIVLATMLVVGWLLFLPAEYQLLGNETLAGSLFLANFALWREAAVDAGYFNTLAQLKPMLHLWSLGVEEQFYIGWPLAMAVLWKFTRHLWVFIYAMCLASFLVCLWMVATHPVAAFYLPVSRIWELAVGAILADATRRHGPLWAGAANWLSAAGTLLMVGSLILYSGAMPYPGLPTVAPTVGAALMLAAGPSAWLNKTLYSNRVAVYVGRISYPLYLWHWPLLVAMRLETRNTASAAVKVGVIALAIALAIATYELVEKRIRAKAISWPMSITLILMMAATGLCGYLAPIARERLAPSYSEYKVDNYPWQYFSDATCNAKYNNGQPEGGSQEWIFCLSNSAAPQVVVFGNSHANHLYPGFLAQRDIAAAGVLNIGTCSAVALGSGLSYSASQATNVNPCEEYLAQQEQFLANFKAQVPSAKFVVLSAMWPYFDQQGAVTDVNSGESGLKFYTTLDSEKGKSMQALFRSALDRSITRLEAQGLKVILFMDVPRPPYDARQCADRPYVKAVKTCVVSRRDQELARARTTATIQDVARAHPSLAVYDPFPLFCAGDVCRFKQGKTFLFRDENHLSSTASAMVAKDFMGWARKNIPGFP